MNKTDKCHKCRGKAKQKLIDKWYCNKCFCGLIEQKIKQDVREYGLNKDDKILVKDPASEYIFREIIKLPLNIVTKGRARFHAIPWTLDDENDRFLSRLFSGKKLMVRKKKRDILLFRQVSKKDLAEYFKLKKIQYSPKRTEIDALLENFEEKHPGTKRAILKAQEGLREII